jgi:basic membrane protein A and related proteins
MKHHGSIARRAWRLAAFLVLGSLVASCGSGVEPDAEHGKLRVGIVFDLGGKDDRSFNAMAWKGVSQARDELGVYVRDAEPSDPAAIEPAMRAFAERGYDLIIGVGFAQGPLVSTVAADFPNLHFAIVDAVVDHANVASLLFKEHEGSFLVGMIAAGKSRSGKIGFVGGMDIPLIHKFQTGYEEGARFVNPNVVVYQNYCGVTDTAWNDPTRAKELASAQFDRGADVIFQAAGNSGMGVFDAASERKLLAIGTDANQNWVKPGTILTSMLKRVDVAVFDTIRQARDGQFSGGIHVYGLDNDGVGYALDEFNTSLIAPDLLDRVEKARAQIVAGAITVTDASTK